MGLGEAIAAVHSLLEGAYSDDQIEKRIERMIVYRTLEEERKGNGLTYVYVAPRLGGILSAFKKVFSTVFIGFKG